MCLYAGEYELALQYVDSVLAQHQCQEALYVKSRCLTKLERYTDADAVNVLMGDVFDMSTPDAKVLYSIAMLNELHIGDPGLNLMQELIKAKPKYDKGILSLRMLMKRKGLMLVKKTMSLENWWMTSTATCLTRSLQRSCVRFAKKRPRRWTICFDSSRSRSSLLSKMTLKSVDAKQQQPCVKYGETKKWMQNTRLHPLDIFHQRHYADVL